MRGQLKNKKKIVVKIGSSSLMHPETGHIDLVKLEKLVRVLSDIRNSGKSVILVSSGAIAVGAKDLGYYEKPAEKAKKQACAAVGQASLMMLYKKLFAEYGAIAAQVLLTKNNVMREESYHNARETFKALLEMGVIPVVNENDTVATDEIEFGDNDTLSAIVASVVEADLLILLSDIDGLYTDDPRKNPDAEFIETVEHLDDNIMHMGKGAGSAVGTGGMSTKLSAASIATKSGADMIIANSSDVGIIPMLLSGERLGTLFMADRDEGFNLTEFLS